jgi:hypothetical protein
MIAPTAPHHVRVVYPNGDVIGIDQEILYRGIVNGIHVWQAKQWVPWDPDAVVEWDGTAGEHYVFPGWDVESPDLPHSW